jgi:hypothetical protein
MCDISFAVGPEMANILLLPAVEKWPEKIQ